MTPFLGPRRGGPRIHSDKVPGILIRILVLLNQPAQFLVARIDELQGREAALVADAGVGAGLEHHADEGEAEGVLGGGFGVEPADGGVEGGVAFEAVLGVAFEAGLVEEEIYYFVCFSLFVRLFVFC